MREKSILTKCWHFSIWLHVDSVRPGLLEQKLAFAIFSPSVSKETDQVFTYFKQYNLTTI